MAYQLELTTVHIHQKVKKKAQSCPFCPLASTCKELLTIRHFTTSVSSSYQHFNIPTTNFRNLEFLFSHISHTSLGYALSRISQCCYGSSPSCYWRLLSPPRNSVPSSNKCSKAATTMITNITIISRMMYPPTQHGFKRHTMERTAVNTSAQTPSPASTNRYIAPVHSTNGKLNLRFRMGYRFV